MFEKKPLLASRVGNGVPVVSVMPQGGSAEKGLGPSGRFVAKPEKFVLVPLVGCLRGVPRRKILRGSPNSRFSKQVAGCQCLHSQ